MTTHTLGRLVHHDERSRDFPAATAPTQRSVLWGHHAPVLDQGQIGCCTGNAMAQCLNTDLFAAARTAGTLPRDGAGYLTEQSALSLYSKATRIDNTAGQYPPTDTGSSGLAVAKAATVAGYLRGYKHAFGLNHFLGALQLQPVIVGTAWTKDMFEPDRTGRVRPTGDVEGGHEYLALGVDYSTRLITFLNSWGDGWGQDGRFHITFDDFDQLLNHQGDATVPLPATTTKG